MSGQRYRVIHEQVQVPMTLGQGIQQMMTVHAGQMLPGNVPAERVAHLLSVKMIEPIEPVAPAPAAA